MGGSKHHAERRREGGRADPPRVRLRRVCLAADSAGTLVTEAEPCVCTRTGSVVRERLGCVCVKPANLRASRAGTGREQGQEGAARLLLP